MQNTQLSAQSKSNKYWIELNDLAFDKTPILGVNTFSRIESDLIHATIARCAFMKENFTAVFLQNDFTPCQIHKWIYMVLRMRQYSLSQ